MVISNNKLKKCGSSIRKSFRNNEKVKVADLETIYEYRNQHKGIISSVFYDLCDISKKVHNNSVVVFRLKRIDTIIRKLPRVTTELHKMHDIAGCRVIVDSLAQINNLVEKLRNHPRIRIKDEIDYIEKPRESGYKSYHLIVVKEGFEHEVEIQIRTRNHHYWATFVEIVDHTFGIKIKEGEDHPEILRIHQLLSKSEEKQLTKSEIIELIYLEKEMKMLEKILKVFRNNYLVACESWIHGGSSKDLEYILLEVIDNKPHFEFYKSFEEAESVYLKKVKDDFDSNVVIVNINKPDITKLFLAYSNYVLVSHPFITRMIEYIFEVILDTKREGDFKKLNELRQYNKELMKLINKGFVDEREFIKEIEAKTDDSDKLTDNIIGWYGGLINRSSNIFLKSTEMEEELDNVRPKLKLKTLIPRFKYWLNN